MTKRDAAILYTNSCLRLWNLAGYNISHQYVICHHFKNLLPFVSKVFIIFVTHRHENENSAKAESYSYPTTQVKASINDDEKGEVYIVISRLAHQTKQTNRTLCADKESEVNDIEFVQASKDILLDGWNRSEVTVEDAAGKDTDKDTKN